MPAHWLPANREEFAAYDVLVVVWAGVALAVLVWLIRILRDLQAARGQLAERALLFERQRIDAELAATIGTALAEIVADGESAARLADTNPAAAAWTLRAVTARSRASLADARHVLSGYRHVSLAAELRTAATLLSVAGLPATVAVPSGDLPAELPAPLRARLRTEVARALTDGTAGSCVIVITRTPGGQLDVEVAAGHQLASRGAA